MTNNNSHVAKTSRVHLAVCMVGLFLALIGSYAQGQQVHQLFYNNSNWADANLAGSLTSSYTGVGASTTTPNNDQHVFYISNTGDVHQLYNVGGGCGHLLASAFRSRPRV
jgi:hypothetical protein